MSYSVRGRNAALTGVTDEGTHLALHTGAPGTTGAGEDTTVVRLPANWPVPAAGEVDSVEVPFTIPQGGGQRTYTHFSVRAGANPAADDYITGGVLDEPETFSDNGGTYRFTATLTADQAPG